MQLQEGIAYGTMVLRNYADGRMFVNLLVFHIQAEEDILWKGFDKFRMFLCFCSVFLFARCSLPLQNLSVCKYTKSY